MSFGESRRWLHAWFLIVLPTVALAAPAPETALPATTTLAVLRGAHAYDRTRLGRPPAPVLASTNALLDIPQVPKPDYLQPMLDPFFASTIERIGNDVGQSTAPVYGIWAPDARHVYSVQEPWNSDNSLLSVENRGGGNSATPMILDGSSYQPRYAPCVNYARFDYRWHPSPAHPHEQINVDSAGT